MSYFFTVNLSFCICKMGMTTPLCGLKCWDLLNELREILCKWSLLKGLCALGLML